VPRLCGFVACANEDEFGRWFSKLRADIDILAREPDAHVERPIRIVIDFLTERAEEKEEA
jgi:hypothetical protein